MFLYIEQDSNLFPKLHFSLPLVRLIIPFLVYQQLDFWLFKPSSPSYFPKLAEVIQGNLTQTNPTVNSAWETVSDVARELNFALTVRDNATGGGQVVSDLVKIDVARQGQGRDHVNLA